MLEAFKIMNAGGKKTQATADELQALINTAKEERSALSEMLTQVTLRSGKPSQTNKTPEQVEKTTAGKSGKPDEGNKRPASLDDRPKPLEDGAKKIKNPLKTVKQ